MSVIECPVTASAEDQALIADDASKFWPSLTLSDFQVQAVSALKRGHHSLVTAHTGAGKTLAAEYAILEAHSRGKRVVYTSPLKALSNTKLMELRSKFPDISFGLITGDIKDNPEAEVLIMTTEILATRLSSGRTWQHLPPSLSFNLNVADLAYVVFDEVHYVNDPDRGAAWEQCFMVLPEHVQLVMLSATIAEPRHFATWVAELHQNKDVHISGSSRRPVPLSHHLWLTAGQAKFPQDVNWDRTRSCLDRPINVTDTIKVNALLKGAKHLADRKTTGVPRPGVVLKGLVRHLDAKGQLPAICFVFSRRQTSVYADMMDRTLIGDPEEASTWASIADKECKTILRDGCTPDNYDAYVSTQDYRQLLRWIQRGVATHHAGMIPVFREMVEVLFGRGRLRLIFATETLAVGVNFSTKSVIFSDLSKYDGSCHRRLLAHEYGQMAGRAGRRGLDTRGDVWICMNLCRQIPTLGQLRAMQAGAPPTIRSSFYLDPTQVLSSISEGGCRAPDLIAAMCARSFMAKECRDHAKHALQDAEHGAEEHARALAYPLTVASTMIDFLRDAGCIDSDERCSEKGRIASGIREAPGVVFAQWLSTRAGGEDLVSWGIDSWACILSIFYPSPYPKDDRYSRPASTLESAVRESAVELVQIWEEVEAKASKYGQFIGSSAEASYDSMEAMRDWANASSGGKDAQARVLADWGKQGISSGDFIKCALKVARLCEELESALLDTRFAYLTGVLSMLRLAMLVGPVASTSLYV